MNHVKHGFDMWAKPDRETSAELARLFNLGTTLTLTLATAVSSLVLFAARCWPRRC
jgi:hypothetical protein